MEAASISPPRHVPNLDSQIGTAMLACLVAIVCYQTDRLVYVLGIPPDHIASFWPASAFLVAVLLLVPRRIWAVLIAAGLGSMAVADLRNGVSNSFEIWISLGNLGEVLVAAFGINVLFKGTPRLNSLTTLAKYLVFAVIFVPIAAALVGSAGTVSGGYWLQWRVWVFADALAFLTVAPAIWTWVHEGRAWARRYQNYLEFAALIILLFFFGYLTFVGAGQSDRPAMLYSLVPLLLWAALRLGLKGVSTSMLLVTFLAIWGVSHGHGPFAGQGPLEDALSLQLFLFFAALPFTFLAVIVEERKRTQQALLNGQALLSEAQRLAQIGTWHWDLGTDTVTWSEELYRIAGRDPHGPAPSFKEHAQIYTPESWEQIQGAVEESLRTGKAYQLDLGMIRPDGTTRWMIAQGEVQRDTAGRIVSLRGTVKDITQRKRAEEALQKSEERFRMAAQAGKMFAYEWDTTTDVIVRSEGVTQVLGEDAGSLTSGQQILALIPPEDHERLFAAVAGLSPEQPYLRIRYRMVRSDGTMIWVERNSRADFDEQRRMVRLVGMIVDVTQTKIVEDALVGMSRRLIEAQEHERIRIARELHDDFVQRLALLSVDLQGMREGLPDSAAELRSQMEDMEKRTGDIAVDVQALSHELHSAKLEYMGLGAAMRGFCAELARKQKVEIGFTVEGVQPTTAQEISLCLFRVMQESLHNAVKHSGGEHFEVKLRCSPAEIHLTVRDSGAGFNPEQTENTHGLGLISMRERVNLVHGRFSITSSPQGGTEVSARIPVPVGTRQEQAQMAGA